jgi:hypothetical protein
MEPISIDRLLLPGERVLWEGHADEGPGPSTKDLSLVVGVFLLPVCYAVFLAITLVRDFVAEPWTKDLLWDQCGATVAFVILVVLVGWAGNGFLRKWRLRRARSAARYYVTTERALLVGVPLEQERLVRLADLDPGNLAVARAGAGIDLLSPSGEVLVSFEDVKWPDAAAVSIRRALAEARAR